MLYDEENQRIDQFTSDLIRRKSLQLVGLAGLTAQDRADIEQTLLAWIQEREPNFDENRAHWRQFVTCLVDYAIANLLRERRAQKVRSAAGPLTPGPARRGGRGRAGRRQIRLPTRSSTRAPQTHRSRTRPTEVRRYRGDQAAPARAAQPGGAAHVHEHLGRGQEARHPAYDRQRHGPANPAAVRKRRSPRIFVKTSVSPNAERVGN